MYKVHLNSLLWFECELVLIDRGKRNLKRKLGFYYETFEDSKSKDIKKVKYEKGDNKKCYNKYIF